MSDTTGRGSRTPGRVIPRKAVPAAEVDLARAALEQARAAYREGRFGDVLDGVEKSKAQPGADSDVAMAVGARYVVAGLTLAQLGHADAAEAMFRSGLDRLDNLRDVALRLPDYAADLGIALAGCGRHADAISVLRHAVSLGESTPDVRRCLGESLAAAGREAEAIEVLADAARRAPLDWQTRWSFAKLADATNWSGSEVGAAWMAAGDGLSALSRLEEALEAYQHADLHGAGGAVRVAVADLLGKLDRHDEALEVVQLVLAEAPDDYHARTIQIETLIAVGRGPEALVVAENLAGERPDDQLAKTLLGLAHRAVQDFHRAVDALREADELGPGNSFVVRQLGVALVLAGRPEEARPLLDQALGADPDDAVSLELRGQVLAQLGELAAGAADLRRAVELEPGSSVAWAALGDLEHQLGNPDEALAAVDRALDLDPEQGLTWALRGDVLGALGRWSEAGDVYREAAARLDHPAPALGKLAGALLNTGDRANLDEAERIARRALELAPDDPYSRVVLGDALTRLGQLDAALTELDRATRDGPGYGLGHVLRGRVLREMDRLLESAAAFARAVELYPDSAALHVEVGDLYTELGDLPAADANPDGDEDGRRWWRRAAEHLAEAVKLDVDDIAALTMLGQVRARLGELDAAEDALVKVRDTYSAAGSAPDPVALADLGRVWLLKGDAEGALAAVDEALALLPDQTNALMTQGEARLAIGRYAEAVHSLTAAAEREPDADVLSALGEAQRMNREMDAALASLTRSYELNPEDPLTLASLAAVHAVRGDHDKALVLFDEALKRDPTSLFAFQQKRDLLLARGEVERALPGLQAAVEQAPEDVPLQIEYADTLRLAGRYQEALAVLNDALWTAPTDSLGLRVMGYTLSALGRHPDAVAAFRRALASDAADIDAVLDLADALARIGQVAEALTVLQESIGREPTAYALGQKSWVLSAMAAFPEAVAAGREAVELDPGNTYGYKPLAWALQHAEPPSTAEALEVYQRAVELDSTDRWLRKGRAEALYQCGMTEQAIVDYEWVAAQPTSATDPAAQHTLGWCLYRLGRYQEASATYSRALPASTDPTALLFDLGLTMWAAGDYGNARERYDEAVAHVTRDPTAGMRGAVWVAIHDLRLALERGLPATDDARSLVRKLRELLDSLPEPPLA